MTTAPDQGRRLRNALGHFATGVTVVATHDAAGAPRGITANSFTSVSLDPAMVLVCIAATAASHDTFRNAESFTVSILAEDQKDISALFATRRPDKFDVARWHRAPGGHPVIDDALSWFECRTVERVQAGDHVILIGAIEAFGYREGRPLGYYRGAYCTLGREDEVAAAMSGGAHTVIGAVLERDGALLLDRDSSGNVGVPVIGADGTAATVTGLRELLSARGVTAEIDFVYAVFEDAGTGSVKIYYRGSVDGDPDGASAFYPFDALPWSRMADPAMATMLRRYLAEASGGQFAIYMGDAVEGETRPVGVAGRPSRTGEQ